MARSLADILEPGGQPVGTSGTRPTIRLVAGGLPAATQMFGELSHGGQVITPPGHTGTLVELSGVGFVGLRTQSQSGPPTIDVNLPSVTNISKIKFI